VPLRYPMEAEMRRTLPSLPVSLALVALSCAPGRADGSATTVLSFESAADLGRVETARCQAALSTEHATEGGHSLRVTFEAADYPVLTFRAGKAYPEADWRAYDAVMLDLYNPVEVEVPLFWQFLDVPEADGAGKGGRTITGMLRHRGPATVQTTPAGLELGIAGLLLSGTNLGRVITWGEPVDTANVTRFQLLLEHPKEPVVLYLDNLRFVPRQGTPLVDRFGQYARREWPGKVHDEEELSERGRRDLAARSRPRWTERDTYGGLASVSLRATGFFRAAWLVAGKERPRPTGGAGHWVLVTPTGHPFFSLGVTGVVMGDQDLYWKDERRKAFLEWLPPREGPFAAAWADSWTGGPSFYRANLVRKYGEDFGPPWARVSAHRLLSWGMNTIGNWSDQRVQQLHLLPYAPCLSPYGVDRPSMIDGLPDMFDPRFAAWADRAGAETVKAGYRDDPWVIGYFVDNELFWAGDWGRDDDPTLGSRVLTLPTPTPAKQALVRLLRERYRDDIAALSRAWGTPFASFEALLDGPVTLTPETAERASDDFAAFLALAAETYYRTVRDAVRRHDPNHLYLGSRFAQAPREAVAAAGKYCDVVSFNVYAPEVPRIRFSEFARLAPRPFVIGEFSFGARDRGMLDAGGVAVDTQAARGQAYAHYVEQLARLPSFVGCHWFEYLDQAFLGRHDGFESSNVGLVDVCDEPYPELTAAIRQANARVYREGVWLGGR
jgi:hypothetical protein